MSSVDWDEWDDTDEYLAGGTARMDDQRAAKKPRRTAPKQWAPLTEEQQVAKSTSDEARALSMRHGYVAPGNRAPREQTKSSMQLARELLNSNAPDVATPLEEGDWCRCCPGLGHIG